LVNKWDTFEDNKGKKKHKVMLFSGEKVQIKIMDYPTFACFLLVQAIIPYKTIKLRQGWLDLARKRRGVFTE